MSKSMPRPWIKRRVLDALDAERRTRLEELDGILVQVVGVNERLHCLEVSDQQHSMALFLPASHHTLNLVSLRNSLIRIEKAQISTSYHHISIDLLNTSDIFLSTQIKLGAPVYTSSSSSRHSYIPAQGLALSCQSLKVFGCEDLLVMGDPIDINADREVFNLLRSLPLREVSKRLLYNQFDDTSTFSSLPNSASERVLSADMLFQLAEQPPPPPPPSSSPPYSSPKPIQLNETVEEVYSQTQVESAPHDYKSTQTETQSRVMMETVCSFATSEGHTLSMRYLDEDEDEREELDSNDDEHGTERERADYLTQDIHSSQLLLDDNSTADQTSSSNDNMILYASTFLNRAQTPPTYKERWSLDEYEYSHRSSRSRLSIPVDSRCVTS